jgi:23S rRNA (uracil1939-C5)-methyltransferase
METDIEIVAFNDKGDGIAYGDLKGKVKDDDKIQVVHALPGDIITAFLYKKRRGVTRGRLLNVVKESDNRCQAPCPHCQICGGCIWQSLKYDVQLEHKEKKLLEVFRAFINENAAAYYPIIPCEKFWHYRNKMEFSFSENRAGTKFLGLMIARARNYVFNVEKCYLASKWFALVVANVRVWWENNCLKAYVPHENSGNLRNLIIRESINTKGKMVILSVSNNEGIASKEIDGFVSCVKSAFEDNQFCDLSIFLRRWRCVKGEKTKIEDTLLFGNDHIIEKLSLDIKGEAKDIIFKISPSSFFQPNTLQAEKIYSTAVNMVQLGENAVVYDLYCGTFGIGMAFSFIAKKVVGIEINKDAAKDAKSNFLLNGLDNCEVFDGDVGEVLHSLKERNDLKQPELVVVDPPRAGLDPKAITNIITIAPKKILYISCNPITQKSNCEELMQHGYNVKIIQPIDQFPHTMHIENIILLEK